MLLCHSKSTKRNWVISNISEFDDGYLVHVRVFLNSDPYNDVFLDLKNNEYAFPYHMFSSVWCSDYETEKEPILSSKEFQSIATISDIDCSW